LNKWGLRFTGLRLLLLLFVKHQFFFIIYIKKIKHTKKSKLIFFPFLARCINCLVLNKILLVLYIKIFKQFFCVEVFPFPKKRYYFCKIFLEKKSSLSQHITKEKKTKKLYTHPLFPTTPSHTTKKISPWNFFKIPTFLP